VRRLLAEPQPRVVDRGGDDPGVDELLDVLGHAPVLAAPLIGDTRVVGLMLLAGRVGAAGPFSPQDLRLAEALANQTSASLEYDRLESAVAKLRELQGRLEHRAMHDSLTELPNRALLLDRLEHALSRRDGRVAVLYLDLDDFKAVNDRLGHAAGDELLKAVASRLRGCLRAHDTPARLGGDEFAIVLEEASAEVAREVADRLVETLGRPFALSGGDGRVAASVGVALSAQHRGGAEHLLQCADLAMYEAKHAGKGRVCDFHPELQTAVMRRHSLKDDLEYAIERDELRLCYQPIVDLRDGSMSAAEALLRWEHPEWGTVSPAAFIPVAEESGLIVRLTQFVLERACRDAMRWPAAGDGRPLPVHVNLSVRDLHEADLADRVAGTLQRSGLPPEALLLELTEGALMQDIGLATAALKSLRDLGLRLAIDDFGAGATSLTYLRSFPLDMLKIAKPFMEGLSRSRADGVLVRTIVELGHALELSVVAEGIESSEDHRALLAIGCELGQGFRFAEPLDFDALAERARAPLAA